MSRKAITALFLVLLLTVQALCPVVAGAETECTHDFKVIATLREGSCTVKGIYKLQCSLCGETKYEGRYAHDFVEGIADATCTEPAMVGLVCAICNATDGEMEPVEGSKPLGHEFALDVTAEGYVAATCEESGHNVYKCIRCDATKEEDVEALGHTWDEGEYVDPDCTHGAGVKHICTVCGEPWVEELTGALAVPPLGHKPEAVPDVAATCKDPGWTGKVVCSVCDEVLEEGEEIPVDENAHVEKLVNVLKPATCTTTGVGKYECALCGKSLGYRVIADGHAWDEGVVTKEATCGEDGEKLLTCSICNETKTEVIPATGEHDFIENVVEATCTEPAMVGLVCTICNATDGEMKPVEGSEPLDHDWVLDTEVEGYVAATCEEGGHNVYKCSRCDETKEEDVKALGHDWDDGVYAAPDCTHGGGVKHICALCGDIWVEEFTGELAEAPLGHKPQAVPDVAATCKDPGWTGKVVCSVCNEVLEEGEEVPVDENAHVAKLASVLKPATCETTGVGKFVCELCGKNLGYRVIADGHDWDEGVVTKEATCGEDGEKLLTCSVCNETKTEIIPATGEHQFEENVVEATCTEPAMVGLVCAICNATDGEMKPVEGSEPLGHDFVLDTEAENYVPATCTEGGHNVYKCTRCDATEEKDVEALGHDWDEATATIVEADCFHGAGVAYSCTRCDATMVEEFTGDLAEPAKEHNPVDASDVEATCANPGWTGKVICSECKTVLVEGEEVPVNPDNHVFNVTVIKPATCSAQGIGRYTCVDCGYSTYKAMAVAHTWSEEKVSEDGTCVYQECTGCGEIKVVYVFDGFSCDSLNLAHTAVDVPEVPATTTSTGLTAGKKCSVCGKILEGCEVIPVITCEHVPGEAVIEDEVPATCTEPGSHSLVVYCTECGDEISRETVTVDALGHTEEEIPAVEPTCTETGLTAGVKCAVCDEILVAQEEIPATGHTEEEVPAMEPTCTEAGLTAGKKCAVCGEILEAQEEIPATGHTEEEFPAMEPTCTEPGMTAGKKCAVCGAILEGGEALPAKGHVEEIIPGKPATCTETGLTDGVKCSVCGETIKAQEIIPTTDHVEEIIPGKPATCTESGLTDGVKCSVCGETIKAQETIDALGHVEEIIPGKPATCTESGLTDGVKCSVCGETIKAQEVIPALGHSYTVRYSFNADYTKRVATYTCTICGDSYSVEEDY